MTIPPTTDPRQAAIDARDLLEYALMHPGEFSIYERIRVEYALLELSEVADHARAVC